MASTKKAKQYLPGQGTNAMDTLNWIVCLRENLDTGNLTVHVASKKPDTIVSEVGGGEFYKAPAVSIEFTIEDEEDV